MTPTTQTVNSLYNTSCHDAWIESTHMKPKDGQIVSGWNGFNLIQCRYDRIDDVWYNAQEEEVTIYRWVRYS
ncbi:hypothetical protein EHM76_01360 [bacterium]|nr:MAG: hypothetical protein EHM76_01360 [bacterium]